MLQLGVLDNVGNIISDIHGNVNKTQGVIGDRSMEHLHGDYRQGLSTS